MPKYLVFADLQATESRDLCFSNPLIPLQRWRVDRFLEDLDEMCSAHSVDGLIDLGDTTDDRDHLPMPSVNQAARLGADTRGMIKLIGNHEQYRRDQATHTGDLYRLWNVVDTRTAFTIGGCTVLASAFTSDFKGLNEWLEVEIARAPKTKPIVILGHWDVVGAKMSGGEVLFGIPKATLDKAQVTLLGHIHKPQVLGQSIYYVGSPFQQNFGEAGEAKRVGLLELEDGEVSLSWIPMTGYPQYYTLSFEQFRQAKPGPEDRFIVEIASPEELTRFNLLPHSFQATKKLLYGEQLAVNAKIKLNTIVTSPEHLLKTYSARQPFNVNGLIDKEELVQVGMSLFEEC